MIEKTVFYSDPAKVQEILNLHVVPGRFNTQEIKKNVKEISPFTLPTMQERKSLFFNVLTRPDHNETITVEGGGVNATIIHADIAATNGYVHIIDHVLGAPYATVLEKLQKDPMMRSTYTLASQSDFIKQINDTTRRYTFFVPSDKAWRALQQVNPSAHKKLFMPDFSYHVS